MILKQRIALVGGIAIGFLTGCGIAEFLPWLKIWPILLIGFIACLLLVWPKPVFRVGLVMLIGLLLGVMKWDASARAWNVSPPYGSEVEVRGWVTTPLQGVSQGWRTVIRVEELKQGGTPAHLTGTLQIAATFAHRPQSQYGDELTFTTKLQRLPRFGTFDGVRYWRVRGVQAIANLTEAKNTGNSKGNAVVAAVYDLRNYSTARVTSILPGTEGTLLLGLLFGNQGQLPKKVADQFRTLGISHLTAVSGYNLTIISLWPVLLAGLLPKRGALVLAAVLVGLFVFFTGAPSSIVRAGLMAWAVLFGKSLGRPPHTLLLIVLTASLMAVFNPFVVKDDAGFALSFLAFFGLVEIGPLMARRLTRIKKAWMRDLISQTLGAQIATLPYLLGVFGQFAFIAPLANVVILPLIPMIMIVGLALVMVALIPASLFLKLLGLLYYPMHALLFVVSTIASIPYISINWPRGGYFPWYFGAVIFTWWVWSKRHRPVILKP